MRRQSAPRLPTLCLLNGTLVRRLSGVQIAHGWRERPIARVSACAGGPPSQIGHHLPAATSAARAQIIAASLPASAKGDLSFSAFHCIPCSIAPAGSDEVATSSRGKEKLSASKWSRGLQVTQQWRSLCTRT
jgi:hypothetical protein